MAGRIAFDLFLFLLPFAAYGLYLWYVRTQLARNPAWRDAPFARLTMVGLALVAISFIVWRELDPTHNGTYVPAHIEDGRIVPGEIRQ